MTTFEVVLYELLVLLKIVCVLVFPVYVCMSTTCILSISEGHERVSQSLDKRNI